MIFIILNIKTIIINVYLHVFFFKIFSKIIFKSKFRSGGKVVGVNATDPKKVKNLTCHFEFVFVSYTSYSGSFN